MVFSPEFCDKVADTGLDGKLRLVCGGDDPRFSLTLSGLEDMGSSEEPELFLNGDALSRIQFTGGSTGLPKE